MLLRIPCVWVVFRMCITPAKRANLDDLEAGKLAGWVQKDLWGGKSVRVRIHSILEGISDVSLILGSPVLVVAKKEVRPE